MFVHDTHLPQLLSLEHYRDPAVQEREIQKLFMPGWHCLAVWEQFRRDGDFRTTYLLGRPLILWRRGDRIRAFLNVCCHRFSLLTEQPRGSFPHRLRCQYHGWEYDETGNTCKIPDAQSFRPLKKGELGLREYRCETVGQMVFVTLDDRAPPLTEYLGPDLTQLCRERFSLEHRLTYIAERTQPCNWKIVIENLLESYHLEAVHPRTFKRFPPAEHCTHTFFPTYDYYIHDYQAEPDSAAAERFICRLTGQALDLKWRHILRYPHLAVGGSGPWYYLLTVFPLTPESCHFISYTLHYPGPRGQWRTWFLHRLLKRVGTFLGKQINREDAAIYPGIQRGTTAPDRPHGGGLISTREERIFAFQRYLLRELGPSEG